MIPYMVQIETWWRDEWLPLGFAIRIEAADYAAALAMIIPSTIRLKAGVYYRIACVGPSSWRRLTPAVIFPALPDGVAPRHAPTEVCDCRNPFPGTPFHCAVLTSAVVPQ